MLLIGIPYVAAAVTLPAAERAGASAGISESQAIAIALRVVEGRVLSVQLIDSKGPPVYRVKVLTKDGRVRTVHVDGNNGEVINY